MNFGTSTGKDQGHPSAMGKGAKDQRFNSYLKNKYNKRISQGKQLKMDK